MSRRKQAPKREILPDPLFSNEIVAKFINVVMTRGKKSVAEKIVYGAFEKLVERSGSEGGSAKAKGGEEGGDEGGKAKGAKGLGGIRNSAAAREVALKAFEKALENVRPAVEVKTRRVGGSNYQIPVEIRPARRVALGMRWLVEAASSRNEKTMGLRLANEILDAMHNRGNAVKKREDVHKMAQANRAFAHYSW
jgi:small subunit ribosomal protein S7